MLSVHLVTDHWGVQPGSCSHIRWLLPLRYPTNTNHFTVTHAVDYRRADVIIVERAWPPRMERAKEIVRRARADGATLIYTTDDNILDLKIDDVTAKWLSPAHLDVIRYLATEADGVIVSTPPLAEQMRTLNRLVLELPNAVDERLFVGGGLTTLPPRRPTPDGRLIIGYMGTATHDADLLAIAPALVTLLGEAGGAMELQLVGGVARPETLDTFRGLPVSVLQVGHDREYPDFVRWMNRELAWDVAIAPLVDNVFTRAKSDIKMLDYAGLGVPAVFSDVGPFARSVRHGETGLLAMNEPSAWLDCLRRLVSDAGLRQRLAAEARREAWSSRILRHRASDWRTAIKTVHDSVHRPVAASSHELTHSSPPASISAQVIVPGTVNYFYNRAGERIAEALEGLGVSARVMTLAAAADENACDWCFLVNPSETAVGHGDASAAVCLMQAMADRHARCVAVALECAQTNWFAESARLCDRAGIDTILDLGFHDQSSAVSGRIAAKYRFAFNGITVSEAATVPTEPRAADRPIPWVLVGHQTAARAELSYRLVREGSPDGFVYLPSLSPVRESGPHLNERQYQQVLRRARVQLWCSHHAHVYVESERFRNSLLAGGLPLKVVETDAPSSEVYPFGHLVVNLADVATMVRELDFDAEWHRFRDEFLALPTLEESMAAFMQLPAPARPTLTPMSTAPEVVRGRQPTTTTPPALQGIHDEAALAS